MENGVPIQPLPALIVEVFVEQRRERCAQGVASKGQGVEIACPVELSSDLALGASQLT